MRISLKEVNQRLRASGWSRRRKGGAVLPGPLILLRTFTPLAVRKGGEPPVVVVVVIRPPTTTLDWPALKSALVSVVLGSRSVVGGKSAIVSRVENIQRCHNNLQQVLWCGSFPHFKKR